MASCFESLIIEISLRKFWHGWQEIGLTKYGRRLGPTAHFDTFLWSMVTIYQMVTQVISWHNDLFA